MFRQTGFAAAFLFLLVVVLTGRSVPAQAQDAGSVQVDSYRQNLQNQLDALNAQIAAQQQILNQTKTQSASLQRDIAILDAQIKSAKLAIKARDISIQQLTADIGQKQ